MNKAGTQRPAFFADPALRGAWHRLFELWKPLLAWHLSVWLLFFLVLGPLGAWLLRFELFRGGAPVVANIDLLAWALSWRGFLHLCLLLGLGLMGAVVRFTGIFLLHTGDIDAKRESVPRLVRRVPRLLPRLFRLCVALAFTGLLWLMGLAAGVFAIYRILLGEFDINYYLAEQPREVRLAFAWLGAWLALWLLPSLWLLGRLLIVLPAYLTGDYRLRAAVKQAWRLPRRRGWRLLRLLGALLLGAFLVRLAADSVSIVLARTVLQSAARTFSSARPLLAAAGALMLVNLAFSFAMGFLVFNLGAILLTRFYYEDTPLHREAPTGAVIPKLGRGLRHAVVVAARPGILLPALVLFAALSLAASLLALSRMPAMKEVQISAHRAGPPPAPENTLAALDTAVAAGADFSEIDLQLTADGRVVVVHDADLMRVAGSPLVVTRAPYAAMRDLVQTPDDGSPPARRKIATLEEFLDESTGNIRLMIELKYYGFDPRLAEAVKEILRDHPARDQTVLMSLDLPAVAQLRELFPDLPVGYLLSIGVGDLRNVPADFWAVSRAAASPTLLRRAARQQREVHVWTVNRQQEMIALMLRGVDGIITDDPALAVRVRDELRDMSAVERLLLRWIVLALPEIPGDEHP